MDSPQPKTKNLHLPKTPFSQSILWRCCKMEWAWRWLLTRCACFSSFPKHRKSKLAMTECRQEHDPSSTPAKNLLKNTETQRSQRKRSHTSLSRLTIFLPDGIKINFDIAYEGQTNHLGLRFNRILSVAEYPLFDLLLIGVNDPIFDHTRSFIQVFLDGPIIS